MHNIIYELIDEVQLAMTGLLDPVYKETIQGHAEVREVFKISKVGTVAGCYVADGAIRRDSQIRVMRDGEVDSHRQNRIAEALQERCQRGQERPRVRYLARRTSTTFRWAI